METWIWLKNEQIVDSHAKDRDQAFHHLAFLEVQQVRCASQGRQGKVKYIEPCTKFSSFVHGFSTSLYIDIVLLS